LKLILVSGKAQSGKDTIATLMSGQLKADKRSVLVTHYADLLKYVCANFLEWDGAKDEKGRRMLQYVGTDLVRKDNPGLWVDFMAQMLKYFHENWDFVIIPDCRFPNEISTMVDKGFDVIHVRVVKKDPASPLTETQRNHHSETALDSCDPDHYIYNNGTLEELKASVTTWIKENLYGTNR